MHLLVDPLELLLERLNLILVCVQLRLKLLHARSWYLKIVLTCWTIEIDSFGKALLMLLEIVV